ncbi:MAG: nicotinamide riboside transporter PnuC [Fimbriimonadaceae bacterium]|nr:MAG: nicotinamide riboside transporter PnuC [Fimbriimonadaceae bacterium]
MKLNTWQISVLLAIFAAIVCIAAQGISPLLAGQPILLFPTDLYNQIEFVGFVSGVVGVYLMVKESAWNYPVGLIWAIAYGIYFFSVAKHFGEASLMLINAIYLIDGWIKWARRSEQPQLPITRLSLKNWGVIIGTMIVFIPVLIALLYSVRGNFVYFDATTTSLALAAQYLTNRKIFESWYFWIAANVVIIPVFIYREYYPTAILYTVFTVMAVFGIKEWRQSMEMQQKMADPF